MSTCIKMVLIEGEDLNKQRGNAWIGRSEGASVVAILLRNVSEGMRRQKL